MSISAYNISFEIFIVGYKGVGTTSTLFKYIDKNSEIKNESDDLLFKRKYITINNINIQLIIWDKLKSQYQYILEPCVFYKKANGFILMYDITNLNSFISLKAQMIEIITNSPENIAIFLVGNKADKNESRVISYKQGYELAQEFGVLFFELSAKVGYNVNNIFDTLSEIIYAKLLDTNYKKCIFL